VKLGRYSHDTSWLRRRQHENENPFLPKVHFISFIFSSDFFSMSAVLLYHHELSFGSEGEESYILQNFHTHCHQSRLLLVFQPHLAPSLRYSWRSSFACFELSIVVGRALLEGVFVLLLICSTHQHSFHDYFQVKGICPKVEINRILDLRSILPMSGEDGEVSSFSSFPKDFL